MKWFRLSGAVAVFTLAGVLGGSAMANGTSPAPTYNVKLTVPASVARSYPFTVTADGVSFNVSRLTVFLKNGACPASANLAVSAGAHEIISTNVASGYSKLHAVTPKFVGTHIVCAYLTSVGTSALTTYANAQAVYSVVAYPKINSSVTYTFAFTTSYTKVVQLTVSGVPAGGGVAVNCAGHGCPLSNRSFTGSSVALSGVFHGADLSPGAKIQISITAPSEVGKVEIFTTHRDSTPTVTTLCQPPGATKPRACAR